MIYLPGRDPLPEGCLNGGSPMSGPETLESAMMKLIPTPELKTLNFSI